MYLIKIRMNTLVRSSFPFPRRNIAFSSAFFGWKPQNLHLLSASLIPARRNCNVAIEDDLQPQYILGQ